MLGEGFVLKTRGARYYCTFHKMSVLSATGSVTGPIGIAAGLGDMAAGRSLGRRWMDALAAAGAPISAG